jgi:hypothetical protein
MTVMGQARDGHSTLSRILYQTDVVHDLIVTEKK